MMVSEIASRNADAKWRLTAAGECEGIRQGGHALLVLINHNDHEAHGLR